MSISDSDDAGAVDPNVRLDALYGTYVGALTAAESRRTQISSFYLTLLAAGLALAGSEFKVDMLYFSIGGAFVGVLWLATIMFFRALAQAKFDVVEQFESRFPIAPFREEWHAFNGKYNRGRFLNLSLTRLEMLLPTAVLLVSLGYIGWRVYERLM